MDTPRYYEFMNPVLTALRERGGTLTNEEIVDAVVQLMHLPDDMLERKQQGHNMGEVEYRIAWAKSYLKKAGYLTQSARGIWSLTAEGKATDAVDVRAIRTDVRREYRTRRQEQALLRTSPGETTTTGASVSACYGSAASHKWRSPDARVMGVSTAKGSCGLGDSSIFKSCFNASGMQGR